MKDKGVWRGHDPADYRPFTELLAEERVLTDMYLRARLEGSAAAAPVATICTGSSTFMAIQLRHHAQALARAAPASARLGLASPIETMHGCPKPTAGQNRG